VNTSEFEKIKKAAVVALFSDDSLMETLVLKGGNAIELIYKLGNRASFDLDFSIAREFENVELIRQKISTALKRTFQEEGYIAFDILLVEVPPNLTEDLKVFWGGYRITFKIIRREKFEFYRGDLEKIRRDAQVVGPSQERTFEIDVSKYEFTEGKRPVDLDGYRIYVYSPEMVVCEKLRAICQQMPEYVVTVKKQPSPRPRDFYDIYNVSNSLNIDISLPDNVALLRSIFGAKKVPVSLLSKVGNTRAFHEQGFASVKSTVTGTIAEFGFYFDYVVAVCDKLNTLGVV